MRAIILLGFVLLFEITALSQVPVINKVEPLTSAPQQTILITGSGFSNTPAQLQVWFDHVRGTILSSNNFSIQVQVPPQARLSNVEVINLSTGFSAKSQLKFTPQFGGANFDETKLAAPFTVSDPTELFDICSCDLDLDGKPDFAITKSTNGTPATDLMILKNQSTLGAISFAKVDKTSLAALNLSAPTFNLKCGDLNGDGKPDLVATRNGATRNQIFILPNTNSTPGTLSFGALQSLFLDVSQFAFRVSIRDLNSDGLPELIVSNSFDDPSTDNIIYIYVNQSTTGAISFVATPIKLTVTGAGTTYGLDVQDLDGDSKPEIILNQFTTNNIYIFKNQSTGQVSFAAVQQITVTGKFNNVTSADMDKDGLLDLVLTGTLDNSLQLFINQSTPGNISFKTPQVMTTSVGPWGVDISDIDGDGDPDIIVANKDEAKINVFRQDASLSFTRLDIPTTKPSRNIRVADYDGDGKPDIAFTSFSGLVFSVDVLRNMNCVSPKILNATPLTICTGQTIRLQTTPALGVIFDWSKDGAAPFQSSANEYADVTNITAAGTYTVTAKGESGACSVISPAVVVGSNAGAPPADPVITTNAPLCIGSNLQLSTPLVAGATYQWTGPGGYTSSLQNPTINSVMANNAGLYFLQINASSCSSNKVSSLIDVASLPVFTVSSSIPGAACQGATVTLTVNSASGFTYQWKKDAVDISGKTGLSLAVTQEGAYSVAVTSSSPTCSLVTSATTVILLSVPVANFSSVAAACTGTAVNFTDQSTIDARGTAGYSWAFGDASNSVVKSPTHAYVNQGNLNVSLTVNYAGVTGCSNLISKPITINSTVVPVITPSANPMCPGDTLSVAGSFNSFNWNVGGSGNSIGITQSGDYTVNTLDQNNCPSSATITITFLSLTISPANPSINSGDKLQLTATGADTYAWTPVGSLDNPGIATPIATPTTTTTYQVVGITSGLCGLDSVLVTVNNGAVIKPPLIFSPDGNGTNDTWLIQGIELYPDCTMTIYDGHGSKVYETKVYNSVNSWDGTWNGKSVPDGTYFYVFGCPGVRPATGSVLVVRKL